MGNIGSTEKGTGKVGLDDLMTIMAEAGLLTGARLAKVLKNPKGAAEDVRKRVAVGEALALHEKNDKDEDWKKAVEEMHTLLAPSFGSVYTSISYDPIFDGFDVSYFVFDARKVNDVEKGCEGVMTNVTRLVAMILGDVKDFVPGVPVVSRVLSSTGTLDIADLQQSVGEPLSLIVTGRFATIRIVGINIG